MADRSQVADIAALGDLLQSTAQGDRQAFAELYRLTASRFFAIALRIVGLRDAAEDVVQDAYLTIWRKADQYQPDRGQPRAWMAAIVRRRAIDRLRSDHGRPRSFDQWTEATEGQASLLSHGAVQTDHLPDSVRRCLERLQENHRKAICWAYYYGMTHDELSLKLEAPLGTVKSWVRRGLLQLKDCLDQ